VTAIGAPTVLTTIATTGPGGADTVERRDVKLGRMVDGLRIVTAGLTAGDRVITNGTQKVYPGSKATVAPPAAAPVKAAAAGGARR
jgi:multidrug efflux system membrane fusion protein